MQNNEYSNNLISLILNQYNHFGMKGFPVNVGINNIN